MGMIKDNLDTSRCGLRYHFSRLMNLIGGATVGGLTDIKSR